MKEIELKIYELLGVKAFRFLVFKLEKIIHRRDKGRNINYHMATYDPVAVDGFIKYLFYNGAIHVRNMLVLIIVFLIRYFLFHASPFDILLWLVFLKDGYCVMLQRYNFLRIQIRNEQIKEKHRRRIQRRSELLISQTKIVLNSNEIEECLTFIKHFANSINQRDCVFVGEKDIQVLIRLKRVLAPNDYNQLEEGKI